MQFPFNLDDVRMISIDGDKFSFILPNGHVEIVIDSSARKEHAGTNTPIVSRTNAAHIMFEDGIYGI